MPTQESAHGTNHLLRAGFLAGAVAFVALGAGFLTTFWCMTKTLNAPDLDKAEMVDQAVALGLNVNAVALIVAIPAGTLAVGLIVAGIVRGWMMRKRLEGERRRDR